jgi:hypothetical protein
LRETGEPGESQAVCLPLNSINLFSRTADAGRCRIGPENSQRKLCGEGGARFVVRTFGAPPEKRERVTLVACE